MKAKPYILKYITLCFLMLTASCDIMPRFPIPLLEATVRVVDEHGNPLPGSVVTASFRHTGFQRNQLGSYSKKFEKIYDGTEEVRFSYKAESTVAIEVIKEGYWNSALRHNFSVLDLTKMGTEEHGPYCKSFTVILRRKERPRALEVQRLKWTTVPGYDEAYGFDLERSDWVSPHGQGKITDMLFTFSGERISKDEFSMNMEIVFPGEGNGLIEVPVSALSRSNLLLGQTAPLEGFDPLFVDYFSNEFVNRILRPLSRRTQKEWAGIEGYWFRIRTEEDENAEGGIKARYGKIDGQIKWSGRPEQLPRFSFTYFLAPDHSRSLEWNGESLIPGANLQGVNKR